MLSEKIGGVKISEYWKKFIFFTLLLVLTREKTLCYNSPTFENLPIGEKRMNKRDIINKIYEERNYGQAFCQDMVNSVFDIISEALLNGEKVTIFGFGTFELKERARKEGLHPSSGERIVIESRKVPAFKASKLFIEKANKK